MIPDEAFIDQLRALLPHLEDNSYYQANPLIERLVPPQVLGAQQRIHALRAIIRECIAEMRPTQDTPLRSAKARSYSTLSLRYVDGLTPQEMARELAISERQCYRDLRQAELDLAALLWARVRRPAPLAPTPPENLSPAEIVRREAERLHLDVAETSIQDLVQSAISSVGRLSQQYGLRVETNMPEEPILLFTDRLLAKQVLLNTLSCALQNAKPRSVLHVLAGEQDERAKVEVRYAPDEPLRQLPQPMTAAAELAARLNGRWFVQTSTDREVRITLLLGPLNQTTVLVIDDNEGLVELFQRYAEIAQANGDVGALRIVGAADGYEGLRLAEELAPNIIMLDVMMPQQDGWDVLAQLQSRACTQQIPVIVCSVLNDPELALSLGAAGFLAKPVSQRQFLNALASFRRDRTSLSRPRLLADNV